MTVVVIMLVVLWFDAVIYANNEQCLRGFELALNWFLCFTLHCKPFKKKSIVMKTEEKTSMDVVYQIIFRPSVERRGYYLFHYGHLGSDGTFVENLQLSFSDFLDVIGISAELVADFMEDLSDFELEVCGFGYLSQERFDSFVRFFVRFCGTVQLYPGMMVLTLNRKENEDC